MRLKIRAEEIAIGALLGAATGYALGAPLVLLSRSPLPSLLPIEPHSLAALLHALAAALGPACALAGGVLAARQDSEQHVRGTRYFARTDEALVALREQERVSMSEDQRSGRLHGLSLGGVELARRTEVSHGLLVAQPNSGKTVLLADALDHALGRGDRVLLHDPKNEFIETHYRDDGSVVVLGPWDARAAIWSPGDIDSPALADEFAAAVCGVADAQGPNAYFHRSAASILAGLMKSYMRDGASWSWSDLTRWIESEPVAMLHRASRGDGRVRQIIPGAFPPPRRDGQPAQPRLSGGENSVISTLASSATLVQQLAAVDRGRVDAPRFSFRRWLLGEEHTAVRLVVLNSSAEYATASAALWGAMLSTIAATVSARMPNLSPDAPGALWLLLDELPQLGSEAVSKIQVIAEVGRSRGCRVWAAVQSETQLAARLGAERAAPVLAMSGVRVYLKCSDADAEAVSKRYGDREIVRIETTGSGGAVQGKTARPERQPAILPAALTSLVPDAAGVWLILGRGCLLGRLHHDFGPRRPTIAPAYIEAPDWRKGTLPPALPDEPPESDEAEQLLAPPERIAPEPASDVPPADLEWE